ncbi:PAS domain S-box-containing protein [Pseudomonas sp. URMO17WK12:I1]|uniref:PAS domain-containing sensor histidine kinase n=1 Tax=unclassified Pseudomonas TaxID=196821 RepID=UPI0004836AD8|nr:MULTISPECIES: sensor histidine kinase [unclassified Pseudomonas]PZW70142.1 PAS domain S-box-containing protein [Pseudomonas sp. URMO17WK12:I1]
MILRWLFLLILSIPATLWADEPPAAPARIFDSAQQQWLAANPVLRAGVVLQPPYAQLDRRLHRLTGANVEILNTLAALMGVQVRWRAFQTPEELEQALRSDQLDLASGLSQTPAGLRHWLFSDPFLRVSNLVIGERDGGGAVDLEQLDGRSPVALKGSDAVLDYLRSNYPRLKLDVTATPRQALQRVVNQQASYAVLDEAQLGRLSREPEFLGLAIVGDIGFPQLLRVATRRDRPELAGIVDVALRSVSARELDDLHNRWLPPSYLQQESSASFWRAISLLLGLLLVFALLLALWLRRQRDNLEFRLLAARHEVELREIARDALRLSQFSIDNSTVGILWVNWDSHVRYANQAAESMLGYRSGALVDRPLSDFEPGLSMDRWLELWRLARKGDERPPSFETECLRADGSRLPVDVSLSFLQYRDTEYLVVFITDVTERRRALAALQESEARLQGIAANVPGVVFRLERARPGAPSLFAFIGEGSESLVGYRAATLLAPDHGLRSLVHPDDKADYHRVQDEAFDSDSDWYWQGRMLTHSGESRWVDIKAMARRLADGRVIWDGVVWDISDNKRNELALAESQARLRDLSAHLESVREEEKARIAREVHDELGQVLTVLKLETSMCELGFANLDPGLRERLDNMKKLIANLFQLVRDVATALRPPILDAGIASAIEWQARRFEARTQLPCLVEVPEHVPPLSDAKATGLFRILQEALTNVMRHAEAHTVTVRLELQGDSLCLSISDDGRGFDPVGVRADSFGLVGMRERVLMLGGQLNLDSRPGEGTLLRVRVPLSECDPMIEQRPNA